ncbi:MAG: acyl-CoA thioesterase [Leptospiraceae bacterium]|nr:acyl-CoA thioesterase [Leptospiraceae bacterium]MCK6380466.1 acyl-CoA thioesterase [Leptospiraceae bacterium]
MNIENMDLVTQHIIMSKDLNAHGNLFGGVMLSWIDEACALYVMEKISYTNIVTVNMDDIFFKNPGRNGDIIQIYASIEKKGSSSLTVRTTAIAFNSVSKEKKEIITCKVVFVCLDENRKPFPFFQKNKN